MRSLSLRTLQPQGRCIERQALDRHCPGASRCPQAAPGGQSSPTPAGHAGLSVSLKHADLRPMIGRHRAPPTGGFPRRVFGPFEPVGFHNLARQSVPVGYAIPPVPISPPTEPMVPMPAPSTAASSIGRPTLSSPAWAYLYWLLLLLAAQRPGFCLEPCKATDPLSAEQFSVKPLKFYGSVIVL
jgi:hypothetical protein